MDSQTHPSFSGFEHMLYFVVVQVIFYLLHTIAMLTVYRNVGSTVRTIMRPSYEIYLAKKFHMIYKIILQSCNLIVFKYCCQLFAYPSQRMLLF